VGEGQMATTTEKQRSFVDRSESIQDYYSQERNKLGDSPLTLTHFFLQRQQRFTEATGDLSILLNSIETASKFISSKVRSAGILNLYGVEGTTNVQGEEVKKLDVIANNAFITCLRRSKKVCIMASEENEKPILGDPHGRYVVVFDPLDGSSNIDVNISIGTIFGIYRRLDKNTPPDEKDILQPGNKLVAAGYTMYGSSTNIVLTTGDGDVNGFTLDPASGEFVLTHPNMSVKSSYPIYSVNEGNSLHWYEPVKNYVNAIKFPEPPKKPHSLRYVGSMVADVHRTLLYGGIFMYPADKQSKSGKLRLLYEANPMALLIEQAGGKASTGTERILDLVPTSVHQRTPVFLGSKDNVDALEACFKSKL